jgi:hypothetical protein
MILLFVAPSTQIVLGIPCQRIEKEEIWVGHPSVVVAPQNQQ